LGVAQLQAGQPKDALKELEAVAAPMRSIPEYHLQRARTYLALGRGDDAVKAAKTAEQLAPQTPEPSAMLGAIYATRGDLRKAEEAFRRALRLNDHLVEARYALARLALDEKKEAEALAILQGIINDEPRHVPTALFLAALYTRQARYDQGIAILENVAQATPQ